MADPRYQRHVRQLAQLLSRVEKVEHALNKPQLPNSSVDFGSLNIRGGRLRTWVTDDEGTQYPSTVLGGKGPQSLEIHNEPDAPATFAVSPTGNMTARAGSFSHDISIGGVPLLGTLVDPDADLGAADLLSWGCAAHADFKPAMAGVTVNPGGRATPMGVFMVELRPNRAYQFTMPWRGYVSGTDGSSVHETVNLYMTRADTPGVEPPDPTIDDLYVGSQGQRWTMAGTGVSDTLTTTVLTDDPAAGQPVTYKFMIGLWSNYGVFTPDVDPARVTMWQATLIDVGRRPLPSPVTAPGGQAARTFTSTWVATDSASWDQQGVRERAFGGKRMLQGKVASTGRVWHSAFVCGQGAVSGQTGRTIGQAVDGTVLLRAEVRLSSVYWEESSGGQVQMQPYPHGRLLPSRITDRTGTVETDAGKADFTTRSQTRWIDIPTGWVGLDTWGVMIGPPDWWGPSTHGHLAGADHPDPDLRPRLRLTYAGTSRQNHA